MLFVCIVQLIRIIIMFLLLLLLFDKKKDFYVSEIRKYIVFLYLVVLIS